MKYLLSILFLLSLSFANLFFHKISNDEKYIYRNKLNFEKYESTISNLFHYSTQYEFFDYSNMNEFEIRRKKQEHSKFLSDTSYYPNLISDFNYREDFHATRVLSDFDFDNNLYYIDVKKILNYIVSPISDEVEIINPIEGFNNIYNTSVFFDNYPDELALKIPNLNNAEEFSKKSVTLRVNFKILPKIVYKEKYHKRDISRTMFDQWLKLAKAEGFNYNNMENEELVKYYLDYIHHLSKGRQFIIDSYGTAFNRNYYIDFHCELKSIELLSSVVGTHIWYNNPLPSKVLGCTNPDACNYNTEAEIDDGSCLQKDCLGVCGGNVIDKDNDGICDNADNCIGVKLWGNCYNIETTTKLYLNNNQLTGEIPPDIGNLTNLTSLNLYGNQLTGEIPPEIGNLTNLISLELYNNQLVGEIPSEIGNLTNLTHLYLYNNQLIGEIPPEIGNLTNLTFLDLSWNQLSGEIPPEIGNLTNLERLYLSRNQLTEKIPNEITDLKKIERLDLSYNNFTGYIPSSIGSLAKIPLKNLEQLNLANNQLIGPIPPILQLSNLRFLHLNDNQLTGSMPSWPHAALPNLTNLHLYNNKLTGEIPKEVCDNYSHIYKWYSVNVKVENNKLCPPYPDCISQQEIYSQDTSDCP